MLSGIGRESRSSRCNLPCSSRRRKASRACVNTVRITKSTLARRRRRRVWWYAGVGKGRFGNWRRFPDIARPRETAVATTPPSLHPRIARAYAASASARLASDRVSDSPPPPLRPTNEFMAPGLQFCTAQPLHFSETMPQATVSGKRATRERLLELWWYAGMLVWRYGGVGTRREWHQECRQRTRATPLRVDSMMYGCAFAIQRRSNVAIATTPPFLNASHRPRVRRLCRSARLARECLHLRRCDPRVSGSPWSRA